MSLSRAPARSRLRVVIAGVSSAVLAVPLAAAVALTGTAHAAGPIPFTILHTNDFHGQLQASGSNPGLARVAAVVNGVRASVGAGNSLLVDAGDEMQGSLLSNLQKGAPTIAAFNAMKYDVATFGNHEFDWGQQVLTDRTTQAQYPFVSANIVTNDTGNCSTAGWTSPAFTKPYEIKTVAGVKVGFIGVTTTETPIITLATATQGLCFKDPSDSILHYYDTLKANADVIVVLSHLGFTDGGYGYGIPVYGDQTLADKLFKAGKPVSLIIGGHSHTNVPTPPPVVDGVTTVVQAYYNGRQVGRADMTFDPTTKAVTVSWQKILVSTTGAEDPAVKAVIDSYASDPAYLALINKPVGYVQTDLLRDYNGDNMMGDFVDDAIYNALNTDATTTNDMDLFFNNAGGIRTDWCDAPDPNKPSQYIWSSSPGDCQPGVWKHDPMLLTYGQMFQILPFGNATVVGTMTGAQILQVLNQSATLNKGAIQPAGMRYTFYRYLTKGGTTVKDMYAWGALSYTVYDRATHTYKPLDMKKTYRVGTNEFLAPGGGDGYNGFKEMKNITYWGDMLDAVNSYVSATDTQANPYKGPTGTGQLDGRIARDGTDAPDSGTVTPISVLHNNDSHGNLVKGKYVGYTQLATLIKQEEAKNPGRTLLLNAGDQIQGDAMMYYFKSSYTGKASDGTDLPPALKTNPMMAVMNSLGYDAMTLGNHEFNFGSDVFQGVLGQAKFPILGANVSDTGAYGLAAANGGKGVQPYIEKDLDGIKVGIVGITNHRVPNYELPSNIPGLTFSNPLTAAQTENSALRAKGADVVIDLTHIGFTEDPGSVDVDKNVDTNLAAEVSGVDAVIGGHSHTDPSKGYGDYKSLPTIVAGPDGSPVIINQAYRYNNYLGEVVLGVRDSMKTLAADLAGYSKDGSIDNGGISTSLKAKVDAASKLFAANETSDAIDVLTSLLSALAAQNGKHVANLAAVQLMSDAKFAIAHHGGNGVAAQAGQDLQVTMDTPEDADTVTLVQPYADVLKAYNSRSIGQTTAPIDALDAFTAETNGANLQADAAVWELGQHNIKPAIHLSGAMTNSKVAASATPGSPVTLTVADMFTSMPYENSLVTLTMNGPQLKAVLERGYRNYYYYKYVPGRGGYSYYTTCMLDTNSGRQITYKDTPPAGSSSIPGLPNGNNVVSLTIDGQQVDFTDASTYYLVSTVNYLAAGSCNFNDNGVSLWPLSQIINDTQYYVRDAVIDYITASKTVSPKIEGRLVFKPGT